MDANSSTPRDIVSLRLSTFWFLYLMGLGIFFPYYGLYLRQNLGLRGTQAGLVLAVIPLVGLLTQPLWGQLADRTGSRRLVLAVVSAGLAVVHGGLGLADNFSAALVGTALLAIFSTAVMPLATAVSLAGLAQDGGQSFGRVRMWGTLGFLVAVVSFPRFLARSDDLALGPLSWHGLGQMFPVISCFGFLAAAMALRLPRSPALSLRSRRGDVRRLLSHPPAIRLLAVVVVAHICLQGPINIFPMFIASRGGDASSISEMWIYMLILEIPLVAFSGQTLRRLGPRGLLLGGLLAEGIRWTSCSLIENLEVIRVAQLLHGVGVAGIIVGAPLYLEQAVPPRLRATGQALISSAGFGAGAIVSITASGWLFEHVGPTAPFAAAGVGLFLLGLLLFRVLPAPYRPEPDESDS